MKCPAFGRCYALLVAISLSGCATLSGSSTPETANLLIAEPLQTDIKDEISIARLSQMLFDPEASDDQRAIVLFQRAVFYDRVGLRWLAQLDYRRSLELRPDLAETYNRVGVHYVLLGQFDEAFEAFDSALELEPGHEFALLNRGIALYYAQRYDLAVEDFEGFLSADISDPYRVLWLYLAEYERSPERAIEHLQQNRLQLADDAWGTQIVDHLLGRLSVNELLQRAQQPWAEPATLAERLCEAYFYLAKEALSEGQLAMGSTYLKLTLSTNVYEFVEHRFAGYELQQLALMAEEAEQGR